MAILKDETEEVKKLIKKGLNINCQDNSGATPLHLAAATNNRQLTEILIQNGADKNIKDEFKVTPVHLSGLNLNLKNIWTIYNTKKDLSLININDINANALTSEQISSKDELSVPKM